MVFGVFDGYHEGHRYFLRSARKGGECLIVVVARDEYVERTKKRIPKHNLAVRIKSIKEGGLADYVYPSDAQEGSWNIIREKKPDSIALGYDQNMLYDSIARALPDFKTKHRFIYIDAHEPALYKSSILQGKKRRT